MEEMEERFHLQCVLTLEDLRSVNVITTLCGPQWTACESSSMRPCKQPSCVDQANPAPETQQSVASGFGANSGKIAHCICTQYSRWAACVAEGLENVPSRSLYIPGANQEQAIERFS